MGRAREEEGRSRVGTCWTPVRSEAMLSGGAVSASAGEAAGVASDVSGRFARSRRAPFGLGNSETSCLPSGGAFLIRKSHGYSSHTPHDVARSRAISPEWSA
jgi:hypothetical protein